MMENVSEPLITNVSDTARWIAAYRARESARPDAVFTDPFADLLAGERGYAIADSNIEPIGGRNGWPMVARTVVIDRLVATSIADGCTRILCLASGFDTRPYRLALPAELEWIEVDLPDLIDEKERALAGHEPRCRLHRIAADLSDDTVRRELLAEYGGPTTLVLTEGLLIYLDEATVRTLSGDLRDAEIGWWILDPVSPRIMESMRKRPQLTNAPMKFAPANGIGYYESLGWTVLDIESLLLVAARLRRLPLFMRPLAKLPQPDPRNPGKGMWSAIVRLAPA